MSGARVFIGTRTQSQTRLIEVWSYEDAQRFPWTFLARNLPTVADIGLRKLVKLIGRIPGGKEAKGVGREAVEEWLGAPKAFGMRSGKGADLLKIVPDLSAGYPIGLILNADDNLADIFRLDVTESGPYVAPPDEADYLNEPGYRNVLRIRPRELRDMTAALVDAIEGRQTPMPDHTFWEQALLRDEDKSVLALEGEEDTLPPPSAEQIAVEEAIARDDRRTLRFLIDEGTAADLELSWRVHGWRPITLAARSGATSCLALLLDLGVEVGPDELERAAEAGHGEVVRLILERRPQLRPKPRRRFFPGDGEGAEHAFIIPDVETSDPGQASPA
jgi:hypothetical protein